MIRFLLRGAGTRDLESLFLGHLPFIERVASSVARRHGYQPHDAEDFCSHVKAKFLQDNYSILRKFQGRSSISLYIKTVIHRQWIDYEISQKGKWRPSLTAQKIGPLAVQLEELLYRKRHTFEEAYQILTSRNSNTPPRDSLASLMKRLPRRWGKNTVHMIPLDQSPEVGITPEFTNPEIEEQTALVRRLLTNFIDRLEPADRLILKMRFEDDFTFEEIGRLLKKKKLQVYFRIRKILSDIEKELGMFRLTSDALREITNLRGKTIHLDFLRGSATEQKEKCPSNSKMDIPRGRHD